MVAFLLVFLVSGGYMCINNVLKTARRNTYAKIRHFG